MGSLSDREVACSASDRQALNFESCVWKAVSSHSSHNPQEVLLAQFSLYVHKSGLKARFILFTTISESTVRIVTFSLSSLATWATSSRIMVSVSSCEQGAIQVSSVCAGTKRTFPFIAVKFFFVIIPGMLYHFLREEAK